MTESYGANKFELLLGRAEHATMTSAIESAAWHFLTSSDRHVIISRHPDYGEIEIVAGRQIVTAERLEVLALGTLEEWGDGMPAEQVIESVIHANALPVLPWGFGKWLGRRRDAVDRLMKLYNDGSLFLGDNSGRPGVIPHPSQFTQAKELGIGILRGTDPLPFHSEYNKVGSFGFYIENLTDHDGMWSELCSTLRQGNIDLHNFGTLETPYRFVRNQLAMQFRTRVSNRRNAN